MEPGREASSHGCHIVAMPYPGRGHINPMMNLCKLLCSKNPRIHITFVVTEEWLGFLSADKTPSAIRFATIPNVIPSEIGRARIFLQFLDAVSSKMEAPFELLLDTLETPPDAIVSDTYLDWVVRVGNRRNVPVASLWTMSATMFSILHHFELVRKKQHYPVDISECGREIVEYLPGVPALRLEDFPTIFDDLGKRCLPHTLRALSEVVNAQYVLLASMYELEPSTVEALQSEFRFPVYTIGPVIPFMNLKEKDQDYPLDYIQWLNRQEKESVLYISMGSFLSASGEKMEEIIAGVRASRVPYLWVSRDAIEDNGEGNGMVVPWCNQLRVLTHPSIGGFWTHGGFNSTVEATFAGVPMLVTPLFFDQVPNSKAIAEDWKIGWRIKLENVVSRKEISELIRNFMDIDSFAGKEMRKKAEKMKEFCTKTISKGGKSDLNLYAFVNDIFEKKLETGRL